MTEVIIGSRESKLAVLQSEMVKSYIEQKNREKNAGSEITVNILTMKTTGDIILDRTLDKVGGKGLFVKELDRALLDGKSNLSVHSLKDMPMEVPVELPLVAFSRREDPRDVLIYKSEKKEQGTEEGSILTKTGAVSYTHLTLPTTERV